eukprot:jgi/Tetstr1/444854/TSEL_032696.t1
MSVQPLTMQVIAQSLGIPQLSDQAAQFLAPDVDYRLREIIQEATKFMRHSKRSTLTTLDVDNALRLKNVEPLYGFGSKHPARFARAAGYPDVFYVEDRDINIDQVIEAPLPKVPVDIGVMTHWLVVDGVQPAIPENAPLERPALKRPREEAPKAAAVGGLPAATLAGEKSGAVPKGGHATKAAREGGADNVAVKIPVKHDVTRELQLYYEKVTGLLESLAKRLEEQRDGSQEEEAGGPQRSADDRRNRHLLRAVLASLANDPGLHPLIPYFTAYVTKKVEKNLKSLPMLSIILKVMRCLIVNAHIHIELYLHQLMPALLTCLVAKRLGAPGEDHWALRREAAGLVALICRRFSGAYYNLQPRISRTLLKAVLDPLRPMSTHYGAVVGIAAMGPRVVQVLLLPHLAQLMRQLDKPLGVAPGEAARAEAEHLHGALIDAAGCCAYHRVLAAVDGGDLPAAGHRGGPDGEGQAGGKEGAADGKAGAAPLQEAWKDDSKLGAELAGAHELLGDALLPFIPTAPLCSLFL